MPFVQIQLPHLFWFFRIDVYVMDFQVYHACLLFVCLSTNTAGFFFAFKCLTQKCIFYFTFLQNKTLKYVTGKMQKGRCWQMCEFFHLWNVRGGKTYRGMKTALVKLLLSCIWSINQPLKFGSFRTLRWIYTISTILLQQHLQQNRLIRNGSLISLEGRMWWWGSARQLHAA